MVDRNYNPKFPQKGKREKGEERGQDYGVP